MAKAGARISYGTSVDEVVLADGDRGAVRGVRTAGDLVTADAVVVNADLPGAYGLLPGSGPRRRCAAPTTPPPPSSGTWASGAVLPLACAPQHPLRTRLGVAFRDLDDGRRMSDPSLLVSVPTLSDPELAPPGCSVLYTLEPVPNLTGGLDWARLRGTVRSDCRHASSASATRSTRRGVAGRPRRLGPPGPAAGTPFSLSHRFLQSGPFRPSTSTTRPRPRVRRNRHRPGVGVPMVLLSGKLAAERLGQGA